MKRAYFIFLLLVATILLAAVPAMAKTKAVKKAAPTKVIQTEVRKNRRRSVNWRYEIRQNREALRTARAERIEIKNDVNDLKEKVKVVKKTADNAMKVAKKANEKGNWAGVVALAGLITAFGAIFSKKGRQAQAPQPRRPQPQPAPEPKQGQRPAPPPRRNHEGPPHWEDLGEDEFK